MFYDDPVWLKTNYDLCGSISEMSRRFGITRRILAHRMKKWGIDYKHTTWKTGKTSHIGGYVLVKVSGYHPGSTKHGYVLEHRLVMEQHLGRFLDKQEHVHHINGVKTDNRLENLQLVSVKDHRNLHGGFKPRTQNLVEKVVFLRQAGWLVEEIVQETGLCNVVINQILDKQGHFTCSLCGRVFLRNKALGMHITRTHRK